MTYTLPSLRARFPHASTLLFSPIWWRHQTWVAATEILAGFFVALGLVQGLSFPQVALGVALVYGINGLALWSARHSASCRTMWGMVAWMGLIGSVLLPLPWKMWSLSVCLGALLSFRDQQTMHSLVGMTVRTQRRKGKTLHTLALGSIFGTTYLAVMLGISGWASRAFEWWPTLIGLVACLAIIPHMRPSTHQPMRLLAPARPSDLNWLLRVSMVFNAIHFMGRRIILPVAIVTVSAHYGQAKDALPWLGVLLGMMGAVGTMLQMPWGKQKVVGRHERLQAGARACLLGWALLIAGLAIWQSLPSGWVLAPVIAGWVILEVANRAWAVNFLEDLHSSAVGGRRNYSRGHRVALQRFMVRKSFGAAIGCASAALVPQVAVPVALAFFIGTCCKMLRDEPNQKMLPAAG